MNVIESLKNFFKRFGKRENEEQKLLTSGQTTQESNWKEELSKVNKYLDFQRDDGSTLSLLPLIQQNGEQEYKSIKNEKSGKDVQIPVYLVKEENDMQGAQILSHRILLDINAKQLKNMQPDEFRFFSNVLLSKERLEKVVDEYEGYAGGMYRDPNTRKTYKVTNKWYCGNFET